jgi:hypothetical protein
VIIQLSVVQVSARLQSLPPVSFNPWWQRSALPMTISAVTRLLFVTRVLVHTAKPVVHYLLDRWSCCCFQCTPWHSSSGSCRLATATDRAYRSGHVRFVVGKMVLGQVFSEYFGFTCQFSFHQLSHTHHISSRAGTIGQTVAGVPNGLIPLLTRSSVSRAVLSRFSKASL